MLPEAKRGGPPPAVEIVGAGVLGLAAADAFRARGCAVTVIAESDGIDPSCCSWRAGGMLAPCCEMETAEPLIGALGAESIAYWRGLGDRGLPAPTMTGTLVVAPPRDAVELRRFSQRTSGWRRVGPDALAALEPDLAERHQSGLFFEEEGFLAPRRTLRALQARLAAEGVRFRLGERLDAAALVGAPEADWRIDCRGLAARDHLPDLRGVRGEMLLVRTPEITLSRSVRLLHPRSPIYIVPRGEGVFMIGATMIESEARGGPALRSVLELTAAAVALHPAFGEAEILEIGADARPAFPDNLPRLRRRGRALYLNGAYRHGFLLAPALARRAAETALDGAHFPEISDDDRIERRAAGG